jgi:alpha-L-fucosidase 2
MKRLQTVFIVFCCALSVRAAEDLTIWHDRPAQNDWLRAFPVGNGSLGGMVYGNVDHDEVQLNLDTLYALEPDTACYIPKITESDLAQVQAWLMAGEYEKAADLIGKKWVGRSNAPYVTLGSLRIDCHETADGMSRYRKSLDLSTGVVVTEYELDGVKYRREVFASYPDQALIVRLTADQPGKISATLSLTTPHTPTTTFTTEGNTLLMRGQGPGEAFRRSLEERVHSEGYKYPAFFEQSTNGTYQIRESIKDSGNILYGDEVEGRGTFSPPCCEPKPTAETSGLETAYCM